VATGLDALVPGDTDVAARLRAAGELARRCGSLGAAVESLIAGSLRAAERVAAETDLAARPASIAAAAVRIARDIHGDLSRANALVIGPGDMGERLAQRLQAAGLSRVVLTGRSATRLEQAARRLQCEVVPLASLDEALAGADIVIANMGSSPPAVTAPMIEAALKRRRRKPIFLIDAAIPGDIDRAVGEQEDAFLYDLDDLENVVLDGGAERELGAAAAAAIVAEEAARFIAKTAGTEDAAETALLRRRFETARAAVLEETKGADAAAATRLLVDRLLPQMAALVREAGRRASAVPRGDEPRNPEAARTPGKKDGAP
jgi:glutamyl-tRNA reductase